MRILGTLGVVAVLTTSVRAQECVRTKPPKDAVVLVKGEDCSQWKAQNGEACPWPTKDGVMTVERMNILTKREFGDVQLHIEFQIPPKTDEDGHGHGNSGVYLHGDYEIQVIDSHGHTPDTNASCGAIYGQVAPMVDASLPSGKWQSLDVLFRAPEYDGEGKCVKKARLSVVQNGIWIHHDVAVDPTPGGLTEQFRRTGPLWLQHRGHPVRYRNIWIRELKPEKKEGA